jgi:hypothetical protein
MDTMKANSHRQTAVLTLQRRGFALQTLEGSYLTPWSLTVPTHRRINLLARPVVGGGSDGVHDSNQWVHATGRRRRRHATVAAAERRAGRRPRRRVQFVTLVLWRLPEFRRGSARLIDYCRSKTDRVLTVVPSGLLIT